MKVKELNPRDIVRPFQFLAVCAIVLVLSTSGLLTAALRPELPAWLRPILAIGALVAIIGFGFLTYRILTKFRPALLSDQDYVALHLQEMEARVTSEYRERFDAQQRRIPDIAPEKVILAEARFGKAKFDILHDDIVTSAADVLVSSDDNHLQARGGVAKAILNAAGSSVAAELCRRRAYKLRQGKLAVTSGGELNCRAIIHPAVIDLDENRYPDEMTIRSIVRASIHFAISLGASSIAFPVIGGGTASKSLTPAEGVQVIVSEIVEILSQQAKQTPNGLTYVALYVFDRSAVADLDLPELLRPKNVAVAVASGDTKKASPKTSSA